MRAVAVITLDGFQLIASKRDQETAPGLFDPQPWPSADLDSAGHQNQCQLSVVNMLLFGF